MEPRNAASEQISVRAVIKIKNADVIGIAWPVVSSPASAKEKITKNVSYLAIKYSLSWG